MKSHHNLFIIPMVFFSYIPAMNIKKKDSISIKPHRSSEDIPEKVEKLSEIKKHKNLIS